MSISTYVLVLTVAGCSSTLLENVDTDLSPSSALSKPSVTSTANQSDLAARIYLGEPSLALEQVSEKLTDPVHYLELWASEDVMNSDEIYDVIEFLNEHNFTGPLNWEPAPVNGFPVGNIARFIRNPLNGGVPKPELREDISGILWESGVPFVWDHMGMLSLLYLETDHSRVFELFKSVVDAAGINSGVK